MRIDHMGPDDWAHHDPTLPQRLARAVITRPGRWWLRYRAFGHQPRVPEAGGFLLAPAPHGAYMDPLIFALGQQRNRLRFMAKYQVLEWLLVGRIVRWGGGFPVHRGGGRSEAALVVARHVVESGDGLVLFMEGGLVLDHDGLGTPRNGLARLALWTGAPVVPVAAWGAKRAMAYGRRWWPLRRPKVTVVWGAPITVAQEDHPSDERVAEVRELIWEQVVALYEQARVIHHAPGRRPPEGLEVGTPEVTA